MHQQFAKDLMTILRAGSITRAAKSLYITQSALSQRVKRMEDEFGTVFLDRSVTPIRLTYAGEKFMAAMLQITSITTALRNELYEIEHEAQGRMRLGISLQRGMQILPLVIPTFTSRYPRVRIELSEYGSSRLERMLHEGLCDVALITTEPRYADLHYELLESEEVVLIAAKSSTFAMEHADEEEVPITAAKDEKFVFLRQGHSVRVLQDELFLRNQIEPHPLLETDSLEAAKRLAAEGAALMLCPSVFITQSPEVDAKVKRFRVENMDYKRHFFFSYRKDMVLPRFMLDFLDIVRKVVHGNKDNSIS